MKVIVDTCVWSAALRRPTPPADGVVALLRQLIDEGRVAVLGPIRQELLSGIKNQPHYERLRDALRSFPDLEIRSEDYEEAALHFNACRRRGLQASNTDFLIFAVAVRLGFPILTTDSDFTRLARHLPIQLLKV